MARKRKSEAAAGMDDADRALYSAFCGAANSLSHLYSKSLALQKQAFRSGELHALEKLSQWMRIKHADGSRVTVADIMAHIEHEMDNEGSNAQVCQNYHPVLAGRSVGKGGRNKSEANFATCSDDVAMDIV